MFSLSWPFRQQVLLTAQAVIFLASLNSPYNNNLQSIQVFNRIFAIEADSHIIIRKSGFSFIGLNLSLRPRVFG